MFISAVNTYAGGISDALSTSSNSQYPPGISLDQLTHIYNTNFKETYSFFLEVHRKYGGDRASLNATETVNFNCLMRSQTQEELSASGNKQNHENYCCLSCASTDARRNNRGPYNIPEDAMVIQ